MGAFRTDGGEQKRCVLKDEINHDNRAKDWDVMKHFGPVVRRPLALPGCTWGKVNVRPLGFYEGYVKTGTVIAHGRGTMMWRDGNIYRGEWRDGMMHGEVGEFSSRRELLDLFKDSCVCPVFVRKHDALRRAFLSGSRVSILVALPCHVLDLDLGADPPLHGPHFTACEVKIGAVLAEYDRSVGSDRSSGDY